MAAHTYAIGVDYGTNSCRALLVRTADGAETATAVFPYPSGEAGILLDPKDPNVARQNPRDYIDGFIRTVAAVVREAARTVKGFSPEQVVGIGVDTTGSTPLPVNADGLPLAIEQTFFRVAQEALSNVARHSRASAVTLQLTVLPEKVRLEISDNGVGFDPQQAAGRGFGLESMRTRLAELGGQLIIHSSAEEGARICATAPLRDPRGL